MQPGEMRDEGEGLTLAHREEIDALLAARPDLAFSEASFANLFLFRGVHDYRFHRRPWPHIAGVTYDGVRHTMPLVALSPSRAEALLARAECLYPVDAAEVAELGPDWQSHYIADDSDYLFDTAALRRLPKKKRQQAERLEQALMPALTLDAAGFEDLVLPILDQWLVEVGKPRQTTDYDICREAIAHAQVLGLQSAIVSIAGTPRGFLLGSGLPDGSVAVHFAKATRTIPGLYPWLFSRFARRCGRYRLNFEQDLGHAGLRQAKRALEPLRLLHKYRVSRAAPANRTERSSRSRQTE
jgi:hypothetical protein